MYGRPHSRVHTWTRRLSPVWCSGLQGIPKPIQSIIHPSIHPPIHPDEAKRILTGHDCGHAQGHTLQPSARRSLTHHLPHTASAESSCTRQRCRSGEKDRERLPLIQPWDPLRQGGEVLPQTGGGCPRIHSSPDSPPVWRWLRPKSGVLVSSNNWLSRKQRKKSPDL